MFRILMALFCLLCAPLAWANPVDINTAGVSELDSLPGIGPSKAQAIVTYRTENGPFASVDDLDHVPGIGAATLDGLREHVSLGAAVGAPPAPAANEPPAAAPPPAAGPGVNINTATAAELQGLPGVGATKAAAIVADRTANGPFASCRDLVRVTGIGPATVGNLEARCRVE